MPVQSQSDKFQKPVSSCFRKKHCFIHINMSILVNLLVAGSNLIVFLIPFPQAKLGAPIILLAMTASILYHLAETKHNLPGVYPFNLYTQELLNVDCFLAWLAAFTATINVFKTGQDLKPFVQHLSFAFLALFLSEMDQWIPQLANKPFFAATHCIWHFMAFTALCQTFSRY